MKRFTQYILLAAILGLSACTKVIEVDIDQAPARVVIEGEITNGAGPHIVHLSKSVGISDANTFPEVQGAFVRIADDEGNADTLLETRPGYYASNSLTGRPTHAYTLTVTVGDQTYTATSTMPAPIVMDSVFNLNVSFFGSQRYPVIVMLQDPGSQKNQYRFVTTVNGNRQPGSISQNDDFFDGQSTQIFLQGVGAEVVIGDTIMLQMQCIDPSVYEYFSSFGSSGGGPGGSSAPANPYTNLSGGAMGYFNACAIDTRTIVIQ
jgi:Domain of unknown function (DUF4249)